MRVSPLRADNAARRVGVLLAIGYFLLCAFWVKEEPISWNDISRIAAIESLTERGTWAIDQSPWFDRTEDKVFLNGRFYSDKMPLLSWLAAGSYGLLYRLGVRLAPDCVTCAYSFLTLMFVSLPAAILIALMFLFACAHHVPLGQALFGTLAFGLATMILPYSLVLNHNLPAAACLFFAYYLFESESEKREFRLLGVGFFAALAVMFEPLSGIFTAVLFALTAIRFRSRAIYFVLGVVPPLLITIVLDLQISGSILPPYMIPNAYAFPGSVFPNTIGGNGTPDDLPQYAFKMFLGAQGLFAYNPILIFAIIGLAIVASTSGHPLRNGAFGIGAAFALLALYLATRTGNLGGEAYGERWFLQTIPLLMAFLFFALPLSANFNAWWRWSTAPLFALVLMVSMLSTYQGTRNPWRYVPPPAHPTRNAQTGQIGWRWEVPLPWR